MKYVNRYFFWIAAILVIVSGWLYRFWSLSEESANSPTMTGSVSRPKNFPHIPGIKEDANAKSEIGACAWERESLCVMNMISRFSLEKNDDQSCDVFTDEKWKMDCVDSVNMELAKRKSDVSYCEKVSKKIQDACRQQVVIAKALDTKDPSACDMLSETEYNPGTGSVSKPASVLDKRSHCVEQVAFSLEDTQKGLQACELVKSKNERKSCREILLSRIEAEKWPDPSVAMTGVVMSGSTITGSGISQR